MRVLVTGSTGFIGSRLIELLQNKGYQINALARRRWVNSPPSWLKNTTIFFGDITDPTSVQKAVKQVDVVFHTASLLGRWQSEFPESEFNRVNVGGTRNLVNACLKENIKHFIYLSSAGVMGRLKTVPVDETAPLSPDFPYEKSKCYTEAVLRSFIANGFSATIIRPTHVYGPRDKSTVKIFRTIKKIGVFPLIGSGTALFQPVYVDDLVRALYMCMEHKGKSAGSTYLIAGKQRLTYRDFVVLSAKKLNTPLRTFAVSERLSKPIAQVIEKTFTSLNREPPLTRSRVEFFSRNQAYKIEKIYQEIGFFPQTGVETGLQKTIDWFKANGQL